MSADEAVSGGSLAEMLRILREERAEERRIWEQRLEEERRKQEEERKRHKEEIEQRTKTSEEQLALMRRLVEEAPRRSSSTRPTAGLESLKVSKLTEADDIEAYLTTFERVMTVQGVVEEHWALWLAPQLTGKAQQAYAAMTTEEARQYDRVKAAILRRYDISEETYRQRFRAAEPKNGESPVELTARLRDVAEKWLKDCDTKEKVVDAIVKEQIY